MKNHKVVQLETPHTQQVNVNRQVRRRVHVRRCERIVAAFLLIFLFLGFQIVRSRHSLAKVNINIHQTEVQLASQKAKGRELNQQVKQLHDPEYLQQVIRSKYNYSKKGETVYNLDN
ncbi:FtsB family cell division protein [Limosilactobacillus sp.]|uniref:FtsB family cell division protein n=1 Tax=Limosilactobacillus sp. TaxID=2773925 RepID=UPI003F000981